MLRKSGKSVKMRFTRAGGSIVVARTDLWKATSSGWKPVTAFTFNDPTNPAESQVKPVPAGSYTCVFQCFVEESLNGKYQFQFDVGSTKTFADEGDVNTTSAPNDTKVFKDQFILEVQ